MIRIVVVVGSVPVASYQNLEPVWNAIPVGIEAFVARILREYFEATTVTFIVDLPLDARTAAYVGVGSC